MAKTECADRVVGGILASWRYDISGIAPEMRKDYERHLAECAHCSARQKVHRTIDVTLAILTSLSVLFFLFALAVIVHIGRLIPSTVFSSTSSTCHFFFFFFAASTVC